jgi:DNA-binding transcriptional regulator/RsmH inhibitor MraZ
MSTETTSGPNRFAKGNRFGKGAPPGNRNAQKDRAFRRALLTELGKTEADQQATLRKLARRVINAALHDDLSGVGFQAIREIWDRIDGKPRQETAVTDADGQTMTVLWPLPPTTLDQ